MAVATTVTNTTISRTRSERSGFIMMVDSDLARPWSLSAGCSP